MFSVKLLSLVPFSLACSTGGTAFYGVFLRDFKYSSFFFVELVINSLFYALCIAMVTGALILIIKFFAMIFGGIMQIIGVKDKIKLERLNDENIVNIKIHNGEIERFVGEFKIMKINDEVLTTPLVMGVHRGDDIEKQIVIPPGEPVGIKIGVFDNEAGIAYITDAHRRKIDLFDQSRIYTKLSGNLENGEEIVKENGWFLRYQPSINGKSLSLSNLIEMSATIGIGSFDVTAFPKLWRRKQ